MDTHKAFIPYSPGTFANCPPGSGHVVQAAVTKLDNDTMQLDRVVNLNGQDTKKIPYKYLVSFLYIIFLNKLSNFGKRLSQPGRD